MPLEVVQGSSRNRTYAKVLADFLRPRLKEGTLYLGYPVLATADERVDVDALLVSQAHGVVAFQLADDLPADAEAFASVRDEQDRLYRVLESSLGRHDSLRSGRRLVATPSTATVFGAALDEDLMPDSADGYFGDLDGIEAWLATLTPVGADVERALQGALQRVTNIKPAKRRASVKRSDSRGAVLKELEKGIANLDRWQKAAAIESPEGPQRIRGLAGSGKTVVLALKAAYWHTQHPDWRIALTFQSRALYQQMEDLTTRFTFEHSNDRPDDEQLNIMHSWGSRSRPGVYSVIASALGEIPRSWEYASSKYGMDDAFRGICRELLDLTRTREISPIFDAVLIDEAQDLPPEFFKLVYAFTKHPKRIVWGYDELQKLSESAMPTTNELFGTGPNGESLISLHAGADEPRRDIVLPVCYRNTPWALSVAHALGIGVYRSGGLVQHPDEPELWHDIGYNVVHGELREGSHVTLERSATSYPSYFERLTANDAVRVESFPDEAAQDAWVASQIEQNITVDEIEHDDILVVLPDSYRAKSRGPRLMKELASRGIDSHLAGVNTSVDEVFRPGSVALAHIFRAKGNEAPMVYAIDSQNAASSYTAVTARNTLFTAITRSRAWVRVTGWGEKMPAIAGEIGAVLQNDYQLKFQIPTSAELARLRRLHGDRTEADAEAIRKATDGLAAFLEAIDRGELEVHDLPPRLRTRLTANLLDELPDDNR